MVRQPLTSTGNAPGNQPEQARLPTRQALFPTGEPEQVSRGALIEAERSLTVLGFDLERLQGDIWKITWPGLALTVWRYSPAQFCQFVRDQAPRYARTQQFLHQSVQPSLQQSSHGHTRSAIMGGQPTGILAETATKPRRQLDGVELKGPHAPTTPG